MTVTDVSACLLPDYRFDFGAHRDGASQVRPLAFDTTCDCFLYTGPLRRTAS